MNILIVDDNEANLYQLNALLSGNGYHVVTAGHGAEALDKARHSPPDLVIADVLMPVMDGFALCREWKHDQRLKSIPFMFYTATYTDERDREFALSLGAERFIVKPEEPDVFLRTIGEFVDRAAATAQAPAHAPAASSAPLSIDFPEVKETGFLRQYNEVLVHKLEHKLVQLEQVRLELERDIAERKRVEEALCQARDHLEVRVRERTAELQCANEALERTLAEGQRREQEIQRLNRQLELRLAEVEAAHKELESFTYSVSHDLRAPVRRINGFSSLLLEDYAAKLDDKGKQNIQIILSAAQKMRQLIDDLLGLSQVTGTKLSREQIDLSALAQSVIEDLRRGDPGRNVNFVIPASLTAHADPNLLRIVLENLLANAWKFTSKKEGVRIELGQTERSGERIFFVRDNGAGFNMAGVNKLFNAFQRLHSSAQFPGTGIGLAIVQRIIQRHGGRVWGEGEPEKGACFYFSLPQLSEEPKA